MNNPTLLIDPNGMDAVGADGLTMDQWVEASRPGADPNYAYKVRQQKFVEQNPYYNNDVGTQQKSGYAGSSNSNFWPGFIANILGKLGENGEYHGKFSSLDNGSVRIDYSYGVNDGKGNVLNTDVIGVLTTSGSQSAPPHGADRFHFINGPGNWQQAAVINLTMKIVTSYGGHGRLEIPYPLFFGMPKKIGNMDISNSAAAYAAQSAVVEGFFLTKEVWIAEQEMPYVQVQQLWIKNMDTIMRMTGGTVGRISAKGYMSPIIDCRPD
jgi:hypothetical protein